MEIHAQLDIPTKLFSPAPRSYSRVPNSCVHPFDAAVPGFLPVLSQAAVHAAVLTAAACNCEIQRTSRFERKHYFYADLPHGYQITQQRWPLATNGILLYQKPSSPTKRKGKATAIDKEFQKVGINRIQIEQDTGKTTAVTRMDRNDGTSQKVIQSLIDLNRAGCALVEIVFNPDIRSANDAAAVMSTLRNLLKHIGTCDGRMEEGSLRCDLNVSIAPLLSSHDSSTMDTPSIAELDYDKSHGNLFRTMLPPGTGHRVEVKNLNSIKQIQLAATYEAKRQALAQLEGIPTAQETRTFNVKTGTTILLRSKEEAVDYRFLPEPDLPPLVLNEDVLDGCITVQEFVAKHMPELPDAAVRRLQQEYNVTEDAARVIAGDPSAIDFFEETVRVVQNALEGKGRYPIGQVGRKVSNWLCNDLFSLVKEASKDEDEASVQESTVSASQLGELLVLLEEGTVSTPMAKKLLIAMYKEDIGRSPRQIANERNWKVITDMVELKRICREVVNASENASQLEQFKSGGSGIRRIKNFFIGKIMAASRGNAHPELLQDALDSILQDEASGAKEK